MKSPQSEKDLLLLGEFLSYLRQREFTIGVDHYLRVQQLIGSVGGRFAPEDLKTLLCPLVATSKAEQERFYAAFDNYFRLRQPLPPTGPRPISSPGTALEKSGGRLVKLVPLATFILLLSALMLPPHEQRLSAPPQGDPDSPMDTKRIDSIAVLYFADQVNQPNLNERLLDDLITFLSEHAGLKVTPSDKVTPYRGQEVNPQEAGRALGVLGVVSGQLTLQGDDVHIDAELVNVADGFQLWSGKYVYKLAGVMGLLDRIALDISDKVWATIAIDERPKPLPPEPVGIVPGPGQQQATDAGLPEQTLPELPPSFWQRNAIAIRICIVLAPLALFLIYEAVRSMSQRHALHEKHGKRSPLTWPIHPQLQHLRIYDSEQFYEAARSMRRRQAGDFYRLDVAATITATIRAAGYPAFRYKSDSKLPEYIALIDRASPRDHQTGLHAELVKALEADGIFLIRFFYDRDPRICLDEKGESIRLSELHDRYPGHRLLVFGDGEGLLDPMTGQLAKWSEVLHNWEHRALLTPESPARWGLREFVLADQFVVLPASIDGLLALADSFATTAPLDLRVWLKRASKAPPGEIDGEGALDPLRSYLGDEVFQWLCACAVYPELHWGLTLYLGSLPEVGKDLLKDANLTRLVRLPWFRTGSIPDQVRLALIKQLPPETESRVRLALIALLENGPRPPDRSLAADAHKLQLAAQRWLYSKDRKTRRELLRVMKAVPQNLVFRDRTLLRLLESGRSRVGTLLHRRLLKPFYKAFIPEFGLKTSARVMVAVAAMVVAFASTSGMSPPDIPDVPEDAEPDQRVAQGPANANSSNANTGPAVTTNGNVGNSNTIPGNVNANTGGFPPPPRGGEFHAEPYLYLAGLTHESALIAWGAFYFRVTGTVDNGDFKLVSDEDLINVRPPRRESIGARSEPYGQARVEVFDRADKLVAFAETTTTNHAWLTGLQPDTEYAYRVIVNGAEWAAGERRDWAADAKGQGLRKSGRVYDNRFRTFPAPDKSSTLTFAVIGDYGVGVRKPSTAAGRQREIADALYEAVRFYGVRLILTTGGNIFGKTLLGIPVGETGDDDWFFTFYQPYRYIINRVPIYPAAGNHDTGEAEQGDDRQQLVDNFYLNERLTGGEAAGQSSVGPGLFYRFRYGSDIEFVCIDTSRDSMLFSGRFFQHPNHASFLDSALPNLSTGQFAPTGQFVPWRIPFMHHPPYDAGPRHSNNNSVIRYLVPLFKRAGVLAQFSGYEHNFQYSAVEGINYFITGAGGRVTLEPPTRFADARTTAWASQAHFLLVQINGNEMLVKPVGELGSDGSIRDVPLLDPNSRPLPARIRITRK